MINLKPGFISKLVLTCLCQTGVCTVSPTECFLRYLTLPADDQTQVDLRQSAVVLMSHLDRLACPYLPPPDKQKVCLR